MEGLLVDFTSPVTLLYFNTSSNETLENAHDHH